MITEASRCVAVRSCSAYADVRAKRLASTPRILDVGQVMVTTMATTTTAGVLEIQMYILQVSAKVLVRDEAPVAVGLKATPMPRVRKPMHFCDMLQSLVDAGKLSLAFPAVKLA